MKNCIPLLGVFLCLSSMNNCTNRDEENSLEMNEFNKKENFNKNSNLDSIYTVNPNDPDPPKDGDPDPPKDGDDWLTKP